MSPNQDTKSPYSEKIFKSLWEITKVVLETVDFQEAVQKVVNIVLSELGDLKYGYDAIVLSLLDTKTNELKRIAISSTDIASKFLKLTPIPFNKITIPLSASENLAVKSILENKIQTTTKMTDILYPGLSKEWIESLQENLGTKTGLVFPIMARNKTLGTLILTLNKLESEITNDEWTILKTYAGSVGIALDNALLFKSLTEKTEQLRVANVRLEEVDKLKDEFVSLASHELRTPMTVIKSYVFMLLNSSIGDLTDKQKTYLERTLSSTERLIKLVNDMLNVSRIESGKLTIEPIPADIGKLVSEVITEMQMRAEEMEVNLSYTPPQSSLISNVDTNRIKEVIINLIGNSFKFTPKGGSITVEVSQDEKDFALIKVKDTGQGLSSANMLKLFKKFSMVGNNHLTKEKGQGTGLGLYLSKSLIELHGGKIWAQSDGEGKGSTFSFTLPIDTSGLTLPTEAAVADSPDQKTNTNLPPESNQQA